MSDLNFYRFKNMILFLQPKNSNWCWAACAEQLLKGLGVLNKVGSSQCALVEFYLRQYFGMNTETTQCFKQDIKIPDGWNVVLDKQYFEPFFKEIGLNCFPIDKCLLSSYQELKKILHKNKSPILLLIKNNVGSHYVLITGYGMKNGCEYILESNPSGTENYYELNYYNRIRNIDEVWGIMPEAGKWEALSLERDMLINENFEPLAKHIDFLESRKIELHINRWYKEPKKELLINFSSLKHPIPNLKSSFGVEGSMLQNVNWNNTKLPCGKNYNKEMYSKYLLDILENLKRQIISENIENQIISYNFFENYGVTCLIKNELELPEYLILESPENYDLSSKWLSLNKIETQFNDLEELKYF